MRLLVNGASRGIVAMALVGPLLFGGCDASKAELQATKTKLAAITMERDGCKAQLDTAQASLESVKKERDAAIEKLAAAAAEATPDEGPEVAIAEPVAPVKPAPKPAAPAPSQGKKPLPSGAKSSTLSNALFEKGPAVQQCAVEHALEKGAKKAVVSVRVTINNKGEVVDSRITANVTDGDNSKLKSCVETVMRSAKFPTIPTPLATDERSWTIAAE